MEQTFEDFLISTYAEEVDSSLSGKRFDAEFYLWLEQLDTDLIIAYAEKWHLTRMLAHTVEMYANTNSK